MTWEDLDWNALDRLRAGFLHGGATQRPYWQARSDLASYDLTYGERIGWKWDAVLRELARRRWSPPVRSVLDWGCGSGIAGRRVLAAPGLASVRTLLLWDHSALAREFAAERARALFPHVRVASFVDEGQPIDLLVLSHVLNELDAAAGEQLRALIARAQCVLWVEPGTSAVSRPLSAWRDALRDQFALIAPCPHQAGCGLLTPGNERHWCHFFAEPPPGIQNDSHWVRFGQRAGIDLRSLPYAYLALQKHPVDAASLAPAGAARVLGRVELFKGFARVFSCSAEGVETLELQKRADADLFKQWKRETSHPLYRWRREGPRITGADVI